MTTKGEVYDHQVTSDHFLILTFQGAQIDDKIDE